MNTLKELKILSLNSRKNVEFQEKSAHQPDTTLDDIVFLKGKRLKRKRISLNYKSCKIKTCSMCPFPNDGALNQISDDDVFLQLKNSGLEKTNYDLLTLYHNGNFFADNEINPVLRRKIYQYIHSIGIRYFAVESLPQTLTMDKLNEFKTYCPNIQLQVAIGVQTMNEFLREYSIISPFKQDALDSAISHLRALNYLPRIFIMFGMPFVSEDEAFNVVLSDVKTLKEKYNLEEDVVVCPLVCMDHTLAGQLKSMNLIDEPTIENISELIDIFVNKKINVKITFNSSVYEYTNDATKRKQYEQLRNKICLFNENMLLPTDIMKEKLKPRPEMTINENEIIQRANFFIEKSFERCHS